jgi:hypothetical protein
MLHREEYGLASAEKLTRVQMPRPITNKQRAGVLTSVFHARFWAEATVSDDSLMQLRGECVA